jgi:hypothetical protein
LPALRFDEDQFDAFFFCCGAALIVLQMNNGV